METSIVLRNNTVEPVPVIPVFSDPKFIPRQIRQPRVYKSQQSINVFDRFVHDKGYVEVLSFEDAKQLTIERQWCLFQIELIKFKYPLLFKFIIPKLERQIDEIEEELFMANRLLVAKAIRKFRSLDDELKKDFLAVASNGLLNAIHKYDVTSDASFYTYAKICITNRANNHFRDCIRDGFINPIMTSDMVKVADSIDEDESNIDEVMEYSGLNEDEVKQNVKYLNKYKLHDTIPISLDQPIGDSEEELYYLVEDKQKNPIEDNISLSEIHYALKNFPERERKLIEMRLEGYTLEEIGVTLNVSRARIKQMESAILNKLKIAINT